MALLYRLSFPSGKSYIGVTCTSLDKRFGNHCRAAKRGSDLYVHRAIRKHGADSVVKETLVIGGKDYCYDLEKKAISGFKTLAPDGYNLTGGGEGISKLSESVIKRRAETLRKTLSDPRKRLEISSRVKMMQHDESYVTAHREGIIKYVSENREKLAERARALHADPAIRKKRLEMSNKASKSAEKRRKTSESCKASKGTEKARLQASMKSKEAWKNPEMALKMRDSFDERRRSGKLKRDYIYPNKSGTFSVRIRHDGHNKHVGTFESEDAARDARDEFLLKVGRL